MDLELTTKKLVYNVATCTTLVVIHTTCIFVFHLIKTSPGLGVGREGGGGGGRSQGFLDHVHL